MEDYKKSKAYAADQAAEEARRQEEERQELSDQLSDWLKTNSADIASVPVFFCPHCQMPTNYREVLGGMSAMSYVIKANHEEQTDTDTGEAADNRRPIPEDGQSESVPPVAGN